MLRHPGRWQRYHGLMAMDISLAPVLGAAHAVCTPEEAAAALRVGPSANWKDRSQAVRPDAPEASTPAVAYKIPESVLVIIYRPDGQVLLMHRTQLAPEGVPFWQCVTGSKDFAEEDWRATAVREVAEETGIDALAPGCELQDWALENIYTIYPQWLHRYAPGVWWNTERVFGLRVPVDTTVRLNPREHTAHAWHDWREAARRCYSPSNAEAILLLPRFAAFS